MEIRRDKYLLSPYSGLTPVKKYSCRAYIKKKQPKLFRSHLQRLIDNTKEGFMYSEWNDNGRL